MTTAMKKSGDGIRDAVRDRYSQVARDGAMIVPELDDAPAPDCVAQKIGYSEEDVAAVPDGSNLGVGCGAPHARAALAEGETVLDLGSGAGFDAFLAAREVGPSGKVIGVDMTDEMLEKARNNAAAGGFDNVEFKKGYLEALPLDSESIDVVMSNCVINLVPDKAAVYGEIARVLKPGGRVIVSDVVLDAPLPDVIANDVAAFTGCAAGAALRGDYLDMIRDSGLSEVEVLSESGFGAVLLEMVPPELMEKAVAAGIDVERTAETVRSLTIRARKGTARIA